MTKQEVKKIIRRLKVLSAKLPEAKDSNEIMEMVAEIDYLMEKLHKAKKTK